MSKAVSRYLKVSPRKVRSVIDLVRNLEVERALQLLSQVNKGAVREVRKAIHSALANARQTPEGKGGLLYISKITADEGPTKIGRRWRSAAMGRAVRIRHRQTHLTVELAAKGHDGT